MARTNIGAEKRGDLFYFDPRRLVIVTDKTHPLYDERVDLPLSRAFVDSIAELGVLEPVIVRKNGEENGEPIIEVVDGRQRTRAAIVVTTEREQAGADIVLVPCKFHVGDASTAMLVANVMRQDDVDLVLASKIARHISHGHSLADTARNIGRTIRETEDLLSLHGLSPEAKAACEAGLITRPTAIDMTRLPDTEQVRVLRNTPAEAKAITKAVRETARGRGSKTRSRERRMRTRVR